MEPHRRLSRTRRRRTWRARSTSPATAGRRRPSAEDAARLRAAGGWAGAIVVADDDPEGAWAFCRALRKRDVPVAAAAAPDVAAPSWPTSSCATTCSTTSASPRSTPARSRPACAHLFWRVGGGARPSWSSTAALALNLETYQALDRGPPARPDVHGVRAAEVPRPEPGQGVHPRDAAVSRVWGYEYYGGARTVDVHIRRLRAKLGEEHASLSRPCASVGYRFGQSRWGG